MNMNVSIEVPRRHQRSASRGKSVYVLNVPLELERRVLADAGKQIEAIAFAVAGRVPASKAAELIEIAAKLQNFCADSEVWRKAKT